ncbi:hypothetical protein BOO86_09495 [Mycobacterium sp. CBMA 234]|uniref:hypothetical protein n=1 Tax=Mycolicibacterium sp. CBMA 234 TaxID=1918495 RepID=UPI0012DC4B9F|nr:hypothetical protein [Mycolicibacterium sp. CBMA 234]MUL64693.1 hypothetical protein [Mycolicibacterium sp. CBMA 234]
MADRLDDDVALDTYRYLRSGMVVMTVLLGAGLLVERAHATCWQTSISAYYFTTAHAIFIGALFAIGALLIVYQGASDTENTLLNLAGVLTFVIAVVPTTRPVLNCGTVDPVALATGSAVLFNVWTVAVVLAASRVASWLLFRGAGRTRSTWGTVAVWLQRVVLGIGLVVLIFAPEWFRANAHGLAAAAMFGAIVLTVFSSAFAAGPPCGTRYRRAYQVISLLMAGTLVTVVVLHQTLDGFNHAVLIAEIALIAEFTAYWVVQTIEDNSCAR